MGVNLNKAIELFQQSCIKIKKFIEITVYYMGLETPKNLKVLFEKIP
jgi:hypothetical protein